MRVCYDDGSSTRQFAFGEVGQSSHRQSRRVSERIHSQCLLRTLADTWPCTSARVKIIRQCSNEDEVFIGKACNGEGLPLAVRYRFVHFFVVPLFQHADHCPVAAYKGDLQSPYTSVPMSVCAMLMSRDGRLLLTRRSQKLRAFPGVWVPPGGYVDRGETVLDVPKSKCHPSN